jgi:hypothetical protein
MYQLAVGMYMLLLTTTVTSLWQFIHLSIACRVALWVTSAFENRKHQLRPNNRPMLLPAGLDYLRKLRNKALLNPMEYARQLQYKDVLDVIDPRGSRSPSLKSASGSVAGSASDLVFYRPSNFTKETLL